MKPPSVQKKIDARPENVAGRFLLALALAIGGVLIIQWGWR